MMRYDEQLTSKQWSLTAGLVVVYYFGLVSVLYCRPVVWAVGQFMELTADERSRLAYWLMGLLYMAVLAGYAKVFIQAFRKMQAKRMRCMLWILAGFAVNLIAANMVVPALLSSLIPVQASANQEKLQHLLLQFPFIMTVNIAVIGPLVEELVYRVGVFRSLAGRSRILAYLVSSLLFGFQHVMEAVVMQQNYSELWYMIPYVCTGLIFAYLYDKTRNILVPVGMHVLNNSLGVLLLLLN